MIIYNSYYLSTDSEPNFKNSSLQNVIYRLLWNIAQRNTGNKKKLIWPNFYIRTSTHCSKFSRLQMLDHKPTGHSSWWWSYYTFYHLIPCKITSATFRQISHASEERTFNNNIRLCEISAVVIIGWYTCTARILHYINNTMGQKGQISREDIFCQCFCF